jgi:Domain of unknown function (DUF4062)
MAVKKAFLSSTARDLAEYRDAVCNAINGLDNWKCVRMEEFGARPQPAEIFNDKAVRDCDLFIGILGHRYGSIPEGYSQSYTEKEYYTARGNNRPPLMFLARDDFLLPAHLRENDNYREQQEAFRSRVQKHATCDYFSNPDELVRAVLQAITNWENKERNREQSADGSLSVAYKKESPHRSIDDSSHWRFIESLPERRKLLYRYAHEDWGTGVTSQMVGANYRLMDFLEEFWVRLTEFYPSNNFDGKSSTKHIEEFLQNRFSFHRNKYDVGEEGGLGTMVHVMIGGGVIKDLEEMISDTVGAISLYNDKFDYLTWREHWEETLDSTE